MASPVQSNDFVRKAPVPVERLPLRIAAWAVGSRVATGLLGWWLALRLPTAPAATPRGFHFPPTPVPLAIWANWDGRWYLSIATQGYAGRPMASAFFPGYPVLLKALGANVAAGIALSWIGYGLALYFLWRLVRARWSERAAYYACLAFTFFPTGFFLGAIYTEGLYVAFAAASLYFLDKGRVGRSVLAAAAASAVSVDGILLAVPICLSVCRERPMGPGRLGLVFAAGSGLYAYMLFLAWRFHDPFLFARVQIIWGRHHALPWHTLRLSAAAMRHEWALVVRHPAPMALFSETRLAALYDPVFLAGAFAVVLATCWKWPLRWHGYAWAALVLPLLDPSRGEPLMSVPRLLLAIVPLFAGLGWLLARRPWTRYLYFGLTIPLGVGFLARFVTFHWVA